ncbi:MAG: AbrB/MazE/SpoVT family DNA-binding domain-containing protein [Betaproteobacteria bacterium]|nr:AbrB/MazE/SpoVT family DNA-binding domain-containing protein [Betaproteobacteria bacterium]
MDVIRLGKKGQLSLPAAVLRKMGIQGAGTLLIETTENGAVVLHPAGVYPIEMYTDARIAEFEEANRLTGAEKARVRKVLGRRKR